MNSIDLRRRRLSIAPGVTLSGREAETLRGLVAGRSLQQIAEALATSRKVASVLACRAYRKIGCPDRFSVRQRLEDLGALETLCPPNRPSAEHLAGQLIAELQRIGRYRGGAVLLCPPGPIASISVVLKTVSVTIVARSEPDAPAHTDAA